MFWCVDLEGYIGTNIVMNSLSVTVMELSFIGSLGAQHGQGSFTYGSFTHGWKHMSLCKMWRLLAL